MTIHGTQSRIPLTGRRSMGTFSRNADHASYARDADHAAVLTGRGSRGSSRWTRDASAVSRCRRRCLSLAPLSSHPRIPREPASRAQLRVTRVIRVPCPTPCDPRLVSGFGSVFDVSPHPPHSGSCARASPGAHSAPCEATRIASGEPASARSARLKRHFDANSRRRRRASSTWASGSAVFEGGERRLRGQFPAAEREAQPVAGHRIDEPGGITGEEQAGRAAGRALDGERAEAARAA